MVQIQAWDDTIYETKHMQQYMAWVRKRQYTANKRGIKALSSQKGSFCDVRRTGHRGWQSFKHKQGRHLTHQQAAYTIPSRMWFTCTCAFSVSSSVHSDAPLMFDSFRHDNVVGHTDNTPSPDTFLQPETGDWDSSQIQRLDLLQVHKLTS